jgi:hypothetical protein
MGGDFTRWVEIFKNQYGAAFIAYWRNHNERDVNGDIYREYDIAAVFCHKDDFPNSRMSRKQWRTIGEKRAFGRIQSERYRRQIYVHKYANPRGSILARLLSPVDEVNQHMCVDFVQAQKDWGFNFYEGRAWEHFRFWYVDFVSQLFLSEYRRQRPKQIQEELEALDRGG